MRLRLPLIGMLLVAAPAYGQVRIEDFGFSAGVVSRGTSEITAGATLGVRRYSAELLVGSDAQEAFASALALSGWSRFTFGAGLAAHSMAGTVRPALAAMGAYDIPLAPNRSAKFQLVTRAALMRDDSRVSFGLGVRLAPARGGLRLGEDVAPPVTPQEGARGWDALVAQVMLLDNGESSMHDVMVTNTTLTMRFSPSRRSQLLDDVGRVARVLSGSADPLYLTVSAPEPAFVAAAATAGGFPAERIVTGATSTTITLQATRTLPAAASRSARSSLPQ